MTHTVLLRIIGLLVVDLVVSLSAMPDKPLHSGAEEATEKRAWDILWEGAHDQRTDRRSEAIYALGLLSDAPEAAQLAETVLQDKEPDVRALPPGFEERCRL